MVAGGDEMQRPTSTWWGVKHGLLKCRSVRRKLPGEQWSRRETIEARGTKWNFDVEMDSGISGPPLTSRPDEGMPTATAPREIPTVRSTCTSARRTRTGNSRSPASAEEAMWRPRRRW